MLANALKMIEKEEMICYYFCYKNGRFHEKRNR